MTALSTVPTSFGVRDANTSKGSEPVVVLCGGHGAAEKNGVEVHVVRYEDFVKDKRGTGGILSNSAGQFGRMCPLMDVRFQPGTTRFQRIFWCGQLGEAGGRHPSERTLGYRGHRP